MTTRMSSYPWTDITTPSEHGEYIARLVADDINPKAKRIFWGRGWGNRPALLVEYDCKPWKPAILPLFQNIKVEDHREESCLTIELLDQDMSAFFLKVCLDIISALQDVPDVATRRASILRLERWSSFLRPSHVKMSPEIQKGLIAELRFLERDALSVFETGIALDGWIGPEAGPRDFAYGQIFIEVKSKRSSANPYIVISSEDQLNTNPTERLFLYVSELNSAPFDDDEAFSVTDIVADVRGMFGSPLLRAELDNKLANIGYFDEDDYSDTKWTEGVTYYYEILDGFPKIDSRRCDLGVCKVIYQIDLDYCDDYQVDRSDLLDSME